jgi:succinate-semialdehyde dehydrogenase/glutarate-semialdehyde dehydrogenase
MSSGYTSPYSSAYTSPYLFIGGERLSAEGRDTRPVINPATGETLAETPMASKADLDHALEAAAKGFAAWRSVSAYDRCHIMKRAADLIRERTEEIAVVLTLEQGKVLAEARAEVSTAADVIEWYGEEGKRAYGRVIPSRVAGGRQIVLRQPVGPVVAFPPWNFPALAPARKIGGSLGAGCSCIIKPSQETPATALAVARALDDAGLPKGALNVVHGMSAPISEHLLASPIIRKLTFTGSTAVGKHLVKLAADGVKRVTMELGGHAPVVIFDDVEVESTAALAAASKWRNAGQVCVSPTRFYVQERVYDRFVEHFLAATRAVVVGNGLDEKSKMGPVINSRRIGTVLDFIEDARRRGTTVAAGGNRIDGRGFYLEPTVLTHVAADARIMKEEPFGPVAAILPFHDLEDGIAAANQLPFGLAAYAFTTSAKRAVAIGDALEAGVIGINTYAVSTSETPFGGMKESGYGSEGGIEGLDAYMTTKFINQL